MTEPVVSGRENAVSKEYINFTESTYQESAQHADSLNKPYNTDPLYCKNHNYSVHEDMMIDEQVSVCIQLKKDITLGSGWEIKPGESGQEEIVADLSAALRDDVDKPLENMLDEVISGDYYGFSLSEKIFQRRDDNGIALKTLKTRHPDTWIIRTDDRGNIEKYEQIGVSGSNAVDPKVLIHYINNGKFQNPYGTPDLTAAYLSWFAKREFVKYFAIFGEKSASPIPVGKYPKGMKEDERAGLLTILKKFQIKTAMVIPREMEIEFLEAKSKGEFYSTAINMFNMFIGRAMFVPDLLGLQGGETGGGSYALGTEHLDLFFRHISRRRRYLEWIINKHILRPIYLNNWGLLEKPPTWALKPITESDVFEAAKIWADAAKARIYRPSDEEINKFRGILNFPEGDVDRPEPKTPDETDQNNPDDPNAKPGDEIEGEENEDSAKDMPDNVKPPVSTDNKDGEVEIDDKEDADDKKAFAFKPPTGDYHKKVDFKKIERQLDAKQDLIMAETRPIVEFIYKDMLEQIEKKKIIERKAVDKIGTIKLKKLKDLKLILKSNLRQHFAEAKIQASSELFKSNFTPPLPSQAFLDVLDQETFDYIGDWAYNVTKDGRIELVSAIKDGRPLSSVIDILTSKGVKDSMVSIERYGRTKLTEVLNRGRQEFFEESGAVSGYQYSAILDGRTSQICEGLHGKKFKAGTEPLPPLHFNCRSVLIPITFLEEFKPTTEIRGVSPDAFIEENIGKGFSKS